MKRLLVSYGLSALFGAIGGLTTIFTVALLELSTKFVWNQLLGNNVDAPERSFYIPAVILIAGIIIGVYRRNQKTQLIGIIEVINQILDQGRIDWRVLPQVLITGFISIIGGASLGPEAPSSVMSAGVASAFADHKKQKQDISQIENVGSVSGMLGSLLSSPFLMSVMIIEMVGSKLKNIKEVVLNGIIASAFGIGTYYVLFHKMAVFNLGIPPFYEVSFADLAWAFLIGLLTSAVFAISMKSIQKLTTIILQPFEDSFVKILVSAVIFGVIAYFLPIILFSGQSTIPDLVNHTAQLSFIFLFVIAVAKLFSMALLLKGGFYGGAIFPTLFAGAAFGLAFSNLFSIPVTLGVASAIAGIMTVLNKSPFSAAIITVALVGSSITAVAAMAATGGTLILALAAQQADKS